MESKYIIVKGRVQGVGFRPFVYKIALDNNLKGNVYNSQDGVYINIEGKNKDIDKFIFEIKNRPPKLSYIEDITIEDRDIRHFNYFNIIDSSYENKYKNKKITLLSPDIAICEDCIKDINNIQDRWYKYPFTNCTNCGPRYSIIKDLQYDRYNTVMKDFKMCNKCKEEYKNPLNRRFHAQPICCSECGPKLSLLDNNENIINCDNEIDTVKRLLKEGNIIAIKGLGGFHLACNGKDEKAIQRLRSSFKKSMIFY